MTMILNNDKNRMLAKYMGNQLGEVRTIISQHSRYVRDIGRSSFYLDREMAYDSSFDWLIPVYNSCAKDFSKLLGDHKEEVMAAIGDADEFKNHPLVQLMAEQQKIKHTDTFDINTMYDWCTKVVFVLDQLKEK